MIEKYLVIQSNVNTETFYDLMFLYDSLEEFVVNFPFTERQSIFEVRNELNRNSIEKVVSRKSQTQLQTNRTMI
jgi:hypothetical protein